MFCPFPPNETPANSLPDRPLASAASSRDRKFHFRNRGVAVPFSLVGTVYPYFFRRLQQRVDVCSG